MSNEEPKGPRPECQSDLSNIKTDIAIILERVKVLPIMDQRIQDMDKKQTSLCTKLERNEEDIKELRKKSDGWDLMNSIVAMLAAIGAGIAGLFRQN